MTLTNFKTYVAAYINRDATSFVRGTVDLLTEAINDACRDAQMMYDFNQLKDVGYISTNAFGAELALVYTTSTGTTPLPTKKILSVWQFDDSTGANQKIRQINMILSTDLKNILPTLLDHMTEPRTLPVTLKNRAYVYGTKFYVTGFTDPTVFWVDVVKNLPDLSAESDTNIFIGQYKKWTLFACLQQLNAYLPDTERIQVSAALLDKQWDIVVKHDTDLAGADDTINSLE